MPRELEVRRILLFVRRQLGHYGPNIPHSSTGHIDLPEF
jgi:hypothetical protein